MKVLAFDLLDKIKLSDIEFLIEYLPLNRKKKYETITDEKYLKASLLGYFLLVLLIKEEYDIYYFPDWEEGIKPYDENLGLHFNISHTDNCICAVISDKKVGIDVENIKYIKPELIDKIKSNSEEYIYSSNESNTLFWTQKESIIKMLGKSVLSMNKIDIKDFNTVSKMNKKYIISITEE